jgi:hypothetical protein
VKVFARKEQRPLSILPATQTTPAKSDFEVSSGALRDSFRGWLDTVTPVTSKSTSTKTFANVRVPRLTVLDIMRVNHATIREGESHCIWPAFVLHQLQTAEVITEKKAKHYELRDANLRKVG